MLFRINRNDKCQCGSGKKFKKCCMIVQGLNSISDDSYFIRLKQDKDQYVHLEAEDKEKYVYRIKKGTVGACGWHKKEGEEWIASTKANNLELVKMSEILGNDGTLN